MGAYRKYFWKKFIESVLIHAVDISTSIHYNHIVVVVGSSGVVHYGKFEVFYLIEFYSVGLNMIDHFKHIYPWRWIWLSDSIFINVGVIIILGALNKVGSLGGSFLAHFVENIQFCDMLCTWYSWQGIFVLAGGPVFHISYTYPPSLVVFWTDD